MENSMPWPQQFLGFPFVVPDPSPLPTPISQGHLPRALFAIRRSAQIAIAYVYPGLALSHTRIRLFTTLALNLYVSHWVSIFSITNMFLAEDTVI